MHVYNGMYVLIFISWLNYLSLIDNTCITINVHIPQIWVYVTHDTVHKIIWLQLCDYNSVITVITYQFNIGSEPANDHGQKELYIAT